MSGEALISGGIILAMIATSAALHKGVDWIRSSDMYLGHPRRTMQVSSLLLISFLTI